MQYVHVVSKVPSESDVYHQLALDLVDKRLDLDI